MNVKSRMNVMNAELMVLSATKGDIKTIAKLLADQVDANSRDTVGVSALSMAAMGTALQVLPFLYYLKLDSS